MTQVQFKSVKNTHIIVDHDMKHLVNYGILGNKVMSKQAPSKAWNTLKLINCLIKGI